MAANNLANCQIYIQNALDRRRATFTNPVALSAKIFSIMNFFPKNEFIKISGGIIRGIHDFFGWKAKGGLNNRGLCSGAIYTSEQFKKVPNKIRSGKRRGGNIHIEHTIPVKVLSSVLWESRKELRSSKDVFQKIMRFSVCTAVTREEEIKINKYGSGGRKDHPSFMNDTNRILRDRDILPFIRYYETGTTVLNVITGEKINFCEFSIEDHTKLLKQNDIYSWDHIAKYFPPND